MLARISERSTPLSSYGLGMPRAGGSLLPLGKAASVVGSAIHGIVPCRACKARVKGSPPRLASCWCRGQHEGEGPAQEADVPDRRRLDLAEEQPRCGEQNRSQEEQGREGGPEEDVASQEAQSHEDLEDAEQGDEFFDPSADEHRDPSRHPVRPGGKLRLLAPELVQAEHQEDDADAKPKAELRIPLENFALHDQPPSLNVNGFCCITGDRAFPHSDGLATTRADEFDPSPTLLAEASSLEGLLLTPRGHFITEPSRQTG